MPLFLGLILVASPLIRGQLRKAAEHAATQSQLVEALNGVQTIKAQNAEVNMRWRWRRNYSAFMTENFNSLLIVLVRTIGSFLNQLTGLLTLWVGAFLVISSDLTISQLIIFFRIISGYVVSPLLRFATLGRVSSG